MTLRSLARIVLAAPTSVLLVATNLVPLAGVLFGGWRLGSVMVLYWLENGIVGLAAIARMLLLTFAPLPDATDGTPPAPTGHRRRRRASASTVAANLGTVGFFILHYGLFWTVHGVFVFALFASPDGLLATGAPGLQPVGTTGIDPLAVATGFLSLSVYHVASFIYWDVVKGEARRSTIQRLMFAPYPRLIILHVTILVGAFVVAATGQPIGALVLLVLLKTAIDLGSHLVGKGAVERPGALRASGTVRD